MKSIVFISIFTFFLLCCNIERNDQVSSRNFKFIKLSDGVYSCIHKFGGKAICNVSIVDNGNETFIFDTFLSPKVTSELIDILSQMNLSPVKYVINSHSHNDHIRGNQVFGQDIKIISTTITKELIEKWEPVDIAEEQKYAPARFSYYDSLYRTFKGDTNSREYQKILMWKPYYEVLTNSHREIKTRLPEMFVDSIQSFDGPKRRIQLISKGPGHTESDLVLYLPDDQILFTGDLVFNSCHPYVPHGSISGWKSWLDFLNSLEVNTVVPGHGETGSKKLIVDMKDYLVQLEYLAQQMIDNGQSIDDIQSVSMKDEYKEWWFERFFPSNLRFAYEVAAKKNIE